MTGLMKRPHERAYEVCLAVAGSDPDVARGSTAKGVQAHIEPPLVEIKSDGLHQLLADPSLVVNREGAVERLDGREFLLALLRLLDQDRQLFAELGEEWVDGSLAKTGVVAVEESVARGQFQCLALGLADLLLECEHLRQVREEGEVPVLPR